MTDCNHDCESCSANCGERSAPAKAQLRSGSSVKKVIAVVSGKGGVGKSLVTAMLTCAVRKKGYNTAILDADVTGPSVPQMFGLHDGATVDGEALYPALSKGGTQVMSLNLLLEEESQPVVWRGPVIAGAVTQFWTDVVWKDVDFMFVDMPPGTGDVPLTVFQSLPVDGIVVVTSPQELVDMIVGKAVKMAQLMKVPVLGIVENYSYFRCPDCGAIHKIYGESHVDKLAAQAGVDTVCKLPVSHQFARLCDAGRAEDIDVSLLQPLADKICLL